MRCFGLFFLCFILCSCGGRSTTNELAHSATNSVIALEKTLTAECATDGIKSQITAIKTQITAIDQACEMEKDQIRHDKIKWQTAFWGMFIVVTAFVLKKVVK